MKNTNPKIFKLTRNLLVMFFLSTSQAMGDHFKHGPAWGVGLGVSQYTYPIQFSGSTKKKIDDKAIVLGPLASLGYHFSMRQFVLGFRAEGGSFENIGSGPRKTSTKSDKLNGKIVTIAALVRIGYASEMQINNPVGEKISFLGQFFLEGGPSRGKKTLPKIILFLILV